MRTSNIIKGAAALLLLTSYSGAYAGHASPSPCGAGEYDDTANCMYLALAGSTTASGGYNPATGDRADTSSSLSFGVEVWMHFPVTNVTGGAFDIDFLTAGILPDPNDGTTAAWQWGASFGNFFDTEGAYNGVDGWDTIQVNDFSSSGFGPGGTGGTPVLVGTLFVTASSTGLYNFGMNQDAYNTNTDFSCFVPTDNPDACAPTNFYGLEVAAVPLPAAVWMMIAGIGSLAGFARRKT